MAQILLAQKRRIRRPGELESRESPASNSISLKKEKKLEFRFQIGVVRHVCGEREYCSVFLPAEERTVTILSEDLEPVVPEEGDQVMILSGDEIGFTGRLHTLFHYVGEALIQLDSGAITLVQLTNLAKTPAHLHY